MRTWQVVSRWRVCLIDLSGFRWLSAALARRCPRAMSRDRAMLAQALLWPTRGAGLDARARQAVTIRAGPDGCSSRAVKSMAGHRCACE